ncbi:hypothetical protein GWK47_015939 [Chionoecetes opilio]|uniref:Uncharacterized protein n=1 Tax=Chionoecetes opilio TaxID=41210 RepID=A0A8J4XSX0_CHIOP|nr:hypothetical protein GWK47_015939 [Chionoecetes opilio]
MCTTRELRRTRWGPGPGRQGGKSLLYISLTAGSTREVANRSASSPRWDKLSWGTLTTAPHSTELVAIQHALEHALQKPPGGNCGNSTDPGRAAGPPKAPSQGNVRLITPS